MTAIRIDLDALEDRSESTDRIIRHDTFSRVLAKLVEMPMDMIAADDGRRLRPLALDVMAFRRHDAILVSARRGDGKTTFLTDVLRVIEDCGADIDRLRKKIPLAERSAPVCTLYSLGIVDPTLIETKQNIVVVVIEKIKAAVDRAYEVGSRDNVAYDEFKRALYDLAGGLTLLDGIGHEAAYGKDWADPDYILEKGLDKARGASGFERAFHNYVGKACAFLKRDAVVLAIDDVDTWFVRGWMVLEALRKYFATPHLKVVMAGDLKLYNLVVRQQQWEQISKRFIKAEASRPVRHSQLDQISRMVDTLQDQYLVKIARPENRFDLRPLLHYLDAKDAIVFHSSRMGGADRSAYDILNGYSDALLALRGREDQALIRSILMRLPVRSVLQVIAGAWGLVGIGPAHAMMDEAALRREATERLKALDALRNVASTLLMTLELDENELRDLDPNRIYGVLSQWMDRKGLWRSLPRFHPEEIDDASDLAAIFIAASLVELSRRRPRTMIDYWLRICTVRELIDQGEISPLRKPEGRGAASKAETPQRDGINDLLLHIRATTVEGSAQFVRRLAAWEAGTGRGIDRGLRLSGVTVPGQRLRAPKTVQLELYGVEGDLFDRSTFAEVANSNRADADELRTSLINALPPPLAGYHRALMAAKWSYAAKVGLETGLRGTFANSLDGIHADLVGDARLIALIPGFRITSGQKSENGSYSILPLLAFMGELLDVIGDENPEAAIVELIGRFGQLRSYPTPAASFATDEDPDDLEDGDGEAGSVGEVDEKPGDLVACLLSWIRSVSVEGLPPMAPVTLARIWTRFTYASATMRDGLKQTKTRYLGVLMHRTIVTLLHAVGVECLRAAPRPISPKLVNNPVESSEIFAALLKAARGEGEGWIAPEPAMRFFYAVLSFPLWGFFLARQDDDIFATSSRTAGTASVFVFYRECMERRGVRSPTFDVRLKPPRTGEEAAFQGLFFVLNTVQLQGQRHSDRNAGGAVLAKELRRLKGILDNDNDEDDPSRAPILRRTRRR